jgi:GT2 family glycosyltransferase
MNPDHVGSPPSALRYSIVICTYRRPAACDQTVSSLLPLMPPGGEIVVVDQTPGASAATSRDRGIEIRRVVLAQPGIVRARNFGLDLARGAIVVFVDDDIEPSPGLVEAHLAAYDDPEVGAVAGRILGPDQTQPGTLDPRYRDPVDGWRFTTFDHLEAVDVQTARGCNMSFRRELLVQVGGVDPCLRPPFSFREDTDACFAIRRTGRIVRFVPAACLIHLEIPAGGTRDLAAASGALREELRMYRRHYQHYENNLYFIAKHFSGTARARLVRWSYRDYVGVSRWPWRLAAKNLCFLLALVNAHRLVRRCSHSRPR